MATYYIRKTGSDSNNGLSAGAAWLTLGKALLAGGVASGDIVYVGAGVYREAITVGITPTSEIQFIADASGEFTGDKGDVVFTAYLTNDKTAPGSLRPLTLNGKSYLNFKGVIFVGGNSTGTSCVDASTTHSHHITLRDCTLLQGSVNSSQRSITYVGVADVAADWTIDRCRIMNFGDGSSDGVIRITLPTSASADYDCNFQIKNCHFNYAVTAAAVYVIPSGAGAFKGGGVDVQKSTFVGNGGILHCIGANLSTSIPCTAYDNFGLCRGTGFSATTSGQILEDYNVFSVATPRTNVTAGSNSKSDGSYSFLIEIGQSFYTGRLPRPMHSPMEGSPLLGFGAQSTTENTDILGRPRPAGGESINFAVGAYERHDTAKRETGTTDAGGVGLVITGPGDQEIEIPVNAESTTISVKARFDTNHAATNKPQAVLLANGEIGVAAETLTMAAAVDTWETLAFSGFTPSAKGTVRIRLISRSAAGNGKAFFDTVAGGAQGSQGLDYFNRGEPLAAAVATGAGGGSTTIASGSMRGGFIN